MHPLNGNRLVHVTGGQWLSVNKSESLLAMLLGYPAEPPFDGKSQFFAQGNIKATGVQRGKLTDCPLNRGASGGALPAGLEQQPAVRIRQLGDVVHVRRQHVRPGPYFDDDVLDIYNVAKNKQ
ncbi:hypothetical protein ABZU25_10610 [Micromonospora sp. NPDC005215]|uniref:hypothetical protein n=1 Tax=Micromonospora sp. NPDC005215 TaxID=3157024 RepID=UPI0033B6607A